MIRQFATKMFRFDIWTLNSFLFGRAILSYLRYDKLQVNQRNLFFVRKIVVENFQTLLKFLILRFKF